MRKTSDETISQSHQRNRRGKDLPTSGSRAPSTTTAANQPVIRRNQSNFRFPPAARFGKELSPIVMTNKIAEAWVLSGEDVYYINYPRLRVWYNIFSCSIKDIKDIINRAIIASTHLFPLALLAWPSRSLLVCVPIALPNPRILSCPSTFRKVVFFLQLLLRANCTAQPGLPGSDTCTHQPLSTAHYTRGTAT